MMHDKVCAIMCAVICDLWYD